MAHRRDITGVRGDAYNTTVIHPQTGETVPGFYMEVRDAHWQKRRVPYQLRFVDPMTGQPMIPGLPGIVYVPVTDEVALIRTAPPGGIFKISRAALFDPTTPPFMKPSSFLVPPDVGLHQIELAAPLFLGEGAG